MLSLEPAITVYLCLKHMAWKHTPHINNSDPGHTRFKQKLEKNVKITFTSPSKNDNEKEKEKKNKMAIAKLFGLHANAKTQTTAKLFALHTNTIKKY